MRLLYVSNGYGPHDHRFLEAIVRLGWQAWFLPRTAWRAEERPLPDGVRRLEPPGRGAGRRLGYRFARRLRRVLREGSFDLVHAGPLQDCAWPAGVAGARRLVAMSWGSDLLADARFGIGRWLAGAALRRASAFLGDCQAVRRAAVDLGMDASRIVIFPWGVDLRRFRPVSSSALRRQLGWENARVAICVRSWEPRYGVQTVVQAFAAASQRSPNLRLILAGDGSQRRTILNSIRSHGLVDRVWLPGYVPYHDLPAFYQAADVYLSASSSDGSSVSLLEALACGLPALVSDIPGNREWVEEGVSGSHFPPFDAPRLAELLTTAAATPSLADAGRQARATAERGADWERNVPRLADAYRLALEAMP